MSDPAFSLDLAWAGRVARESYPRSPQPIYCNGVVVGHRYEGYGGEGERVVAVGRDSTIQAMLDEWFVTHCRERRAAQEAQSARFWAECAANSENGRKAARKAVGLEGDDE
jgi:hypothetical protein